MCGPSGETDCSASRSRGRRNSNRPTTDERPLFSDLERTLLKRGLGFYDAFARRNAAAPRASLRTAQAYYWVGLISGALGDATAAAEAYHGAIERFEQLTKEEPEQRRTLPPTGGNLPRACRCGAPMGGCKTVDEKSRQAYSRAIELKPDDILAYLGRATILERLDRAKAVTDYEKAMQLDPQNIDALLACARLRKTRGREYAERTVALAPDNPKCHVELAEKLSTENCTWIGPGRMICPDPEPALKHYARAIELAPASPRGYRGAANSIAGSTTTSGH